MIFALDWEKLFVPQTSPLEILLRGSLVYLVLFLLLRFVLKREAGEFGLTDLLVIVLIADATQNAMADGYESITDGLLLALVIIGWAYLLDWLAFRFSWARRLIQPPVRLLIEEGDIQYDNLRREFLTREELLGELRSQGVEDVSHVKRAYMEQDGNLSVITADTDRRKAR